MNEPIFAHRIRLALDESAERLPYRVTERLAQARQCALARMPQTAPQAAQGRSGAFRVLHTAAASSGPDVESRPSPWMRLAAGAVPVLAVVIGLYGIGAWHSLEEARETAEIDVALLTDDLPIDAYADRGFGVFIRNNRQ
jgi:hypothetical protein